MSKQFWSATEIIESFEIDEVFLVNLEEEEIICPSCSKETQPKLFTSGDMEKIRLAKILVEDMGVNLAGVEVILRMRHNMFEMRKQFDTILEDLAKKLNDTLKKDRKL
jgi:MerR family transcriptional regulator/heat shock protein HspR